jgi:hypothetical protein
MWLSNLIVETYAIAIWQFLNRSSTSERAEYTSTGSKNLLLNLFSLESHYLT